MTSPVLQVRDLSVSFGGLKAVAGVDLNLESGAVVGLIGPNGAGKTTLLDAISGFVGSHGSVVFDGVELKKMPAYERVRRGLGRTFQVSDALRDLSLFDLLKVSRRTPPAWGFRRSEPAERVGSSESGLLDEVMVLLRLKRYGDKKIIELPAGVRRLATVAAAVATQPKVLLLDEPAAGLAGDETLELTRAIHILRDRGLGILVVDHNIGFVARTCDFVYVLHFGRVIFAGPPAEMRENEQVERVYLGIEGSERTDDP